MFLMSISDWDKYFGRITEDELMSSSVFDINKFKKEFYNFQNDIFNHNVRYPSRKFLKTLPYLKNLADRGQIKVVGVGSSRITFAFADGKALKCAMNDAGVAQNKEEIKTIKKTHSHYMCFPQIHDYDKSKFLYLITDCCRPMKKSDIKTFFDVNTKPFFSCLDFVINEVIGYMVDPQRLKKLKAEEILNISIKKLEKQTKEDISERTELFNSINDEILNELDVNERKRKKNQLNSVKEDIRYYSERYKKFLKIIRYLIDNKDKMAVKSIKSLIKYYSNNGVYDLLFADLQRVDNLGIKRINFHDAPIVIDLGFSMKVAREHY